MTPTNPGRWSRKVCLGFWGARARVEECLFMGLGPLGLNERLYGFCMLERRKWFASGRCRQCRLWVQGLGEKTSRPQAPNVDPPLGP